MPQTITAPSSPVYQATCVAPLAGEPRTALSVRDIAAKAVENGAYLKNRTDATDDSLNLAWDRINLLRTFAYYDITPGTVAGAASDLTEALDSSPDGNFSVSSGWLTMPVPGTYFVAAVCKIESSGIDPDDITSVLAPSIGCELRLESSKFAEATVRFPYDRADKTFSITLTASGLTTITSTERIRLYAKAFTVITGGIIRIQRVG